MFDPTPKEASETLKRGGAPSLNMKSEISVTKPVENAQDDDFEKMSYASIVSTLFDFSNYTEQFYFKFFLLLIFY